MDREPDDMESGTDNDLTPEWWEKKKNPGWILYGWTAIVLFEIIIVLIVLLT